MKRMNKVVLFLCVLILAGCGDFPDYRYDQSDQYCVIKFPFAAGLIDRKYIGYFTITSTLQFLDADPELAIYVSGPSNIELEPGSVQKVEIADQEFYPEFMQNYLQGELQYWGPAFLFNAEQSQKIYQGLKDGYDLYIYGRFEVGSQYETQIYNYFFDSDDKPFHDCVNRLLDENDLKRIAEQKKQSQ